MLDGYRFQLSEQQKAFGMAVSWGINFAFADKAQKKEMLGALGVESGDERTPEQVEEDRRKAAQLLRKIETAQIGKRETLSLEQIKGMI
jgi:hypothetical protein